MGSDNKYLVFQAPVLILLHSPALIKITAVCPSEVGGIIDDLIHPLYSFFQKENGGLNFFKTAASFFKKQHEIPPQRWFFLSPL